MKSYSFHLLRSSCNKLSEDGAFSGGINRLLFGNQVHEESGHEQRLHGGDKQGHRDRRRHAVEMDVIHSHRQNRSRQEGEEDHEVNLDVLFDVVCVV